MGGEPIAKKKRRRATIRDIEKVASVMLKFDGNLVGTSWARIVRECGGDRWLARFVARGLRQSGIDLY